MSGDEARALREALGLSGRALGEHLELSRDTVYAYERRGTARVPRVYELALRHLFQQRRQAERGGAGGQNGDNGSGQDAA